MGTTMVHCGFRGSADGVTLRMERREPNIRSWPLYGDHCVSPLNLASLQINLYVLIAILGREGSVTEVLKLQFK